MGVTPIKAGLRLFLGCFVRRRKGLEPLADPATCVPRTCIPRSNDADRSCKLLRRLARRAPAPRIPIGRIAIGYERCQYCADDGFVGLSNRDQARLTNERSFSPVFRPPKAFLGRLQARLIGEAGERLYAKPAKQQAPPIVPPIDGACEGQAVRRLAQLPQLVRPLAASVRSVGWF